MNREELIKKHKLNNERQLDKRKQEWVKWMDEEKEQRKQEWVKWMDEEKEQRKQEWVKWMDEEKEQRKREWVKWVKWTDEEKEQRKQDKMNEALKIERAVDKAVEVSIIARDASFRAYRTACVQVELCHRAECDAAW